MSGRGYLGTGIGTLDGAKRYLRNKWRQSPLAPVQVRPGARFYVSALRGRQPALLLGPYVSHMTALAAVPRARRLLGVTWASVGTCSLSTSEETRFGR